MRLRDAVIAEKRTTAFRRMLKEGPLPLMGVFGGTAHHAQLAEAAGFSHFGVSGAHTSMHILGLPDAGFLTQTELVENTRRICQAVSIPVLVDCDTGFGNALNTMRTVDEIISTGAAALFLEDQVAPKRCGFTKGKEIISVEEAVGKYRAALAVRDQLDPDFIVMARTDARGAVGGGMDEVLKRGRAYLDAGVDVLYVEALQSREEIQTVRDAFPDALLRVTPFAIEPALSTKEIEDFRLCSLSLHVPIYGMIQMYDFLKECAVRGQDAWNEFSEQTKNHPYGGFRFFNLTGFPKVHQFEKEFLPKDNMDRYSNSIGVYDPRSSS
jgi:2-methylisocitrate lyase-like PEP mutase family enzyme